MTIEPAALSFDAHGAPVSERYGDVYASREGALGQARHVFLGGARCADRWRGRGQFVILENGFGLGVNFLAAWQAWRDDPARPQRLHFVSVERHPLPASALVDTNSYTATITTAVKDLTGLALASDYSWNFTAARVTPTWNGTTGNWSDASKWSSGVVPSSPDDVILPAGTYTVTLDASPTIKGIRARATVQRVAARTAVQQVVARVALQQIGTHVPGQGVIAVQTRQRVAGAVAGQVVVQARAVQVRDAGQRVRCCR